MSRITSSGLRTTGSFLGALTSGKSSMSMLRRRRVLLYKKRRAPIRGATVPRANFFSRIMCNWNSRTSSAPRRSGDCRNNGQTPRRREFNRELYRGCNYGAGVPPASVDVVGSQNLLSVTSHCAGIASFKPPRCCVRRASGLVLTRHSYKGWPGFETVNRGATLAIHGRRYGRSDGRRMQVLADAGYSRG
jgi:hypothetical protein